MFPRQIEAPAIEPESPDLKAGGIDSHDRVRAIVALRSLGLRNGVHRLSVARSDGAPDTRRAAGKVVPGAQAQVRSCFQKVVALRDQERVGIPEGDSEGTDVRTSDRKPGDASHLRSVEVKLQRLDRAGE